MSKSVIEESVMHSLVQTLAEALRPEKIILFGSLARGETGPDSDIDLFVQVPAGEDAGEAARKGYAAIRPLRDILPRGVDLVVKDRSFVERYGDLVGSVVRTVKREGKLLYDNTPGSP